MGILKLLRNLQKLFELKNLRKDLIRMEAYDDYKEIFLKSAKEMKLINELIYSVGYSTVLFYLSTPLLDNKFGTKNLPLRQWFPFDVKVTPNYELAYFYQTFYGFFICLATCMSCELCFFSYMIKISAEYDILEKNIQDINQIFFSGNDSKVLEMLKKAADHHQRIIQEVSINAD